MDEKRGIETAIRVDEVIARVGTDGRIYASDMVLGLYVVQP